MSDVLQMRTERVVIVGAGAAGLASALALSARGLDVTVLERAATPGGKIRQIDIASANIDSGPTVFTMRWVFDELFAEAGETFDDYVHLQPLDVLARHAWSESDRLDLFADKDRSEDAIGRFAGKAEVANYRRFSRDSQRIYEILEKPFLRSPNPSMAGLIGGGGLRGLIELPRIKPFTSMWKALGDYFRDPRLRQMFGRYATYCGSSPFDAPATLMLVAHVEREGVWSVDGGMHALATALASCAMKRGAKIRYGSDVREIVSLSSGVSAVVLASGERIEGDAVIMNCDVSAIATGLFGSGIAGAAPAISNRARSLSAMTWSLVAKTDGFPLSRHSVFFSRNYRAEFDDIFQRNSVPSEPTVYVCAQDRAEGGTVLDEERLLVLINAPPIGDRHVFGADETERCKARALNTLARCGLQVHANADTTRVTTPTEFNALFPASGGALYGRSSHGWAASFQRPGVTTKIPGLYLAGGSVHPGPGVPMAVLSGRAAASRLLHDLKSRRPRQTMASVTQKKSTGNAA